METLPISANDGASETLPPATHTAKDFLKWLESLPADTSFCAGNVPRAHDCPVAKFFGRNATYGDESLPAWALTFMTRYDNDTSTSLQHALTIAKALQDEILPS